MPHPSQPCAADCLSKRMNSVPVAALSSITKQNSCHGPECKLQLLVWWGTQKQLISPIPARMCWSPLNTGTWELLTQPCASVPAVPEGKHFQGNCWDNPTPRQASQHTTRSRSWAHSAFCVIPAPRDSQDQSWAADTMSCSAKHLLLAQEGGSERILQAEPWECQRWWKRWKTAADCMLPFPEPQHTALTHPPVHWPGLTSSKAQFIESKNWRNWSEFGTGWVHFSTDTVLDRNDRIPL